MPLTKFTNLDFDQIKASIKSYLRANSNFTDFDFEGSNFAVLIDTLAYNTYITAFNTNMVVNESFIDSATLRENVVSLARNIGYVPRSRKSAQAQVSFDIEYTGTSPTVTLEKGLVAVGSADNSSVIFSIPEDITTTSVLTGADTNGNGPRRASFSSIDVYQGTLLTKQFQVNASVDQRFILDNPGIDTSSIRVTVRGPQDTVGREYKQVENIIDVTSISEIFLIQEISDERYELLFGDGIFGKKLEDGSVIEVSYIVTDGSLGNGPTNFSYTGTVTNSIGATFLPTNTVSVTTNQSAVNGSDIESIDSVKYYAPRLYSSQYRAVTAKDYEAIVQRIYPDTESVSVVGGEELDPPEFGTVVLSIKPKNGTFLSDFTKSQILSKLKDFSVAGVNQRIEDLKLLFIELQSTVFFNAAQVSDVNQLQSDVTSSLNTYADSIDLNKFGGRFKYSKTVKIIDNTNEAITSNITRVIIRRNLRSILNSFTQYELCYGNEFHVVSEGFNIKSTGFTVQGSSDLLYFTDVPNADKLKGAIAIVKESDAGPIVVVPAAGTIDYVKGEILINTINITSTVKADGIIEIQAVPESNDVIGLKDLYLQLDISNSTINMARDTISSGEQISGVGFPVASSYTNGQLSRK
tara:strand:- start:27166 stop:29073 length:1908 start_codon:yes stop_codon:yes gene_type:complete